MPDTSNQPRKNDSVSHQSSAASDSTLKQLTTCGVTNTCTLLFFDLAPSAQVSKLVGMHFINITTDAQ